MKILKNILIGLFALAALYITVLYVRIEVITNLELRNFESTVVPQAFDEYSYRKIFSHGDKEAKVLYRMRNSDLVFLYFTRERNGHDIVSTDEFGPWQYDSFTYVRRASTGLKGNTWPPYF